VEIISDSSGKNKMKEEYKSIMGFGRKLATNVAAYAILGAAGLGIFTGNFSYRHEIERTKNIPLGFSEKTQIEEDAQKNDKVIDPATRYLTSLNDFSMKIFEAWDDSWKPMAEFEESNPYQRFASNLEYKYYGEGHHYKLGDLANNIPNEVDEVFEKLGSFLEINQRMRVVNSNFSDSWTERHEDNYHTVWYPVTKSHTDSEGHTTYSTHMESKQVYDDTDHYYWYHRDWGEEAAKNLEKLIGDYPELSIDLSLISASRTNEAGRIAAIKSREKETKKGKEFNDSDYLTIANTWRVGSVIYNNAASFASPWTDLRWDLQQWKNEEQTAHDQHYKTSSRSDSGPKEYQVTKATLLNGNNLTNSLDHVFNSLYYTSEHLPEVDGAIKSLIELRHKNASEEEIKKVSEELISNTIALYKSNFERGFEIERFRGWAIALWSSLGLLSGAGLGIFAGSVAQAYFGNRCN